MREIRVVGIGPGGVDQITVEAIDALRGADALFELDRAATELTAIRRAICDRHLEGRPPRTVRIEEPRRDRGAPDYVAAVEAWRAARATAWERAIRAELGPDGVGAFLVWGDPSLYDSTQAVLVEVAERLPLRVRTLPGVSSLHALTAAHGIALNRVGGAVEVTTGRRIAQGGLPPGVGDVVVMLDGDCAFRTVTEPGVEIFWGAYLGTEHELLRAGPLAQVGAEIAEVRARARERVGWVMDLYLLRRALE